jgi:hypothetical protein
MHTDDNSGLDRVAAARKRDADQPAYPFTSDEFDSVTERRKAPLSAVAVKIDDAWTIVALLADIDDCTGYVPVTDAEGHPLEFESLDHVIRWVRLRLIDRFYIQSPESEVAGMDAGL